MESESQMLRSENHITGTWNKPNKSNPHNKSFRIHFNTNLQSNLSNPKLRNPLHFSHQICMHFSSMSHHLLQPQPSSFHKAKTIFRREQTRKLFVMHLFLQLLKWSSILDTHQSFNKHASLATRFEPSSICIH